MKTLTDEQVPLTIKALEYYAKLQTVRDRDSRPWDAIVEHLKRKEPASEGAAVEEAGKVRKRGKG